MPTLFDITKFERLFRQTLTAKGLTGSVVNISLVPIKPKTILVLTHVTVEDETTLFTKVRLGINSRGVIHYLDELQTVAAAELIASRSDIILAEGDVFFSALTGTTTSDVLRMTCIGWTQTI